MSNIKSAMKTGGFWSKILVSKEKWDTILDRIQYDNIPEKAIKTGGFWSKIFVSKEKWDIILDRIQNDNIPE
jgi:hypothetical protein